MHRNVLRWHLPHLQWDLPCIYKFHRSLYLCYELHRQCYATSTFWHLGSAVLLLAWQADQICAVHFSSTWLCALELFASSCSKAQSFQNKSHRWLMPAHLRLKAHRSHRNSGAQTHPEQHGNHNKMRTIAPLT